MSTVGELSCENCGVGYGADDIFCENCGYDFITGSLPSGDEGLAPPVAAPVSAPASGPEVAAAGPAAAPAAPAAPTPAPTPDAGLSAVGLDPGEGPDSGAGAVGAPRLQVSVSVDRAYFDAVVSEGELEFPDQPTPPTELELSGQEFHVGRTSQSRAIHPDLDIAQLSGDPAVSSRHAVIRVLDDGTVTVTDVGSTNGTFVGEVDSKAIAVGEPVTITDQAPVYVGAWTRLEMTLLDTE